MSRRFRQSARVHLGDASPSGRLRIDAVLRILQNIADDDVVDAGDVGAAGWVVRRTDLVVEQFPVYLEDLTIETWCSGLGGRWAERTTTIVGSRGGLVRAATVWVHLDPATFRPLPLPERFLHVYGPSAGDEKVSARLRHENPSDAAPAASWPLRFADFDVMGHVNNAAAAAAVEELLALRRELRAPLSAEFEYRNEVPRSAEVTLRSRHADETLDVWICDGKGVVLQSARVSRWTGD